MHVQLVSIKLAKKANKLFLKYEILLKAKQSVEVNQLFNMPFDRAFGGFNNNGEL